MGCGLPLRDQCGVPRMVSGLKYERVVGIVSGNDHMCAIDEHHAYWFWGSDNHRQISGMCQCEQCCGGSEEAKCSDVQSVPHKVEFANGMSNDEVITMVLGHNRTMFIAYD